MCLARTGPRINSLKKKQNYPHCTCSWSYRRCNMLKSKYIYIYYTQLLPRDGKTWAYLYTPIGTHTHNSKCDILHLVTVVASEEKSHSSVRREHLLLHEGSFLDIISRNELSHGRGWHVPVKMLCWRVPGTITNSTQTTSTHRKSGVKCQLLLTYPQSDKTR